MTASVPPLAAVAEVARQAGALIMEWFARADLSAKAKADASPVTQADIAAHACLVRELPKLLPGIPVISEETASDAAATLKAMLETPCFWLIDPLDGTRDFLARSRDFSVNIALMVDGRPALGCVLAPAHGPCYVAATGDGAFAQANAGGALMPVRVRRADRDRFVCLISRSHQNGEAQALRQMFPLVSLHSVGSALKYAQIAAGLADMAVRRSPTSLWDTAAAQCVLEAAGGMLVDAAGQPLTYRTGSLINPPFLAIGDTTLPWRSLLPLLQRES